MLFFLLGRQGHTALLRKTYRDERILEETIVRGGAQLLLELQCRRQERLTTLDRAPILSIVVVALKYRTTLVIVR